MRSFSGVRVESGIELVLGLAARGDIVEDELHEVLIPVSDDRVLDRACRVLAGPGGLPGRAVSVETGAGSGDPVAEPLAGVGEVAVPAQRRGAVLLRVVGGQPVQVQSAQLPQQLRVAVPERRNYRSRQPVGAAEPVDPAVQLQPLGLRFLAGQEVPVDRVRRLRDQRPVELRGLPVQVRFVGLGGGVVLVHHGHRRSEPERRCGAA
jgi:hypothetical protein